MYHTHIFDCDGVLLQSARIKTQAFYDAALKFGAEAANDMVTIHHNAGSRGRRYRVEKFYADVLGRTSPPEVLIRALETEITERIREAYIKVPITPGIRTYLEYLRQHDGRLYVVSGIEQSELVEILKLKGLYGFFPRIYGGEKRTILKNIRPFFCCDSVLYYGDTEDDYNVTREFEIDFAFVSHESDWQPSPDCEIVQRIPDFNLLAMRTAGFSVQRDD